MLIDARTLTEGTTLEADICIAGAGAAGMAIALDLRGSGLSVLLLESGGRERDEATQALSEGRMTGIDTWDLRRMRIRALGGTTGHWAGWCRPLMPQDFEARDYIPGSGWPLSTGFVPWYRRACQTLGSANSRGRRTTARTGPADACCRCPRTSISAITSSVRRHASVRVPPGAERADDVRVVTYANVADVRLDQARGRAESVVCRTLGGPTFHVHAGRYVLALGGVENARVLLASRSQQREGVANGHDVVGRYFMEHPHYYGSIGVVHASALDLSFYRRGDSDLKRADGAGADAGRARALGRGVAA